MPTASVRSNLFRSDKTGGFGCSIGSGAGARQADEGDRCMGVLGLQTHGELGWPRAR
jgi:hypothetical protein